MTAPYDVQMFVGGGPATDTVTSSAVRALERRDEILARGLDARAVDRDGRELVDAAAYVPPLAARELDGRGSE